MDSLERKRKFWFIVAFLYYSVIVICIINDRGELIRIYFKVTSIRFRL